MIRYIREEKIKLDKSRFDVLATYHDPCNYCRKAEKLFGHGFYDEPRWIMDQCLNNWVDLWPNRGASMVVVPCHSCHGQLNNIKDKYDMPDLTVKYLWELVADCLVL
jgi:Fe-S oxidoreductase